MRSFRTSVVLAAAVAALSWSSVSSAEDNTKSGKDTTQTQKSTKSTKSTKSSTKGSTSGSGSTSASGSTSGSGTGSSASGTGSTGGATDTSGTSGSTSGTGTSGSDLSGSGTTGTTGTTSGSMSGDTSGAGSTSGSMSGTGTSTGTSGTGTTGTGTTGTGTMGTGTMGTTPSTTQPGSIYGSEQYNYNQQPYSSTTQTSTTTTTAADYNENVGAERTGYSFRPNRPLLATGAGIFVASYGASAIVAAANDNSSDNKLFIPVAGPWMDLADRPCGLGDCGSTEDWNQALLIGSGVLQGVGVGLAIASLIIPEKRESTTASARERSLANTKPKLHVLPVSVRAGAGVGAVGTF